MYKKRNKYSKKLANMRKAKERKRIESDPPDYPAQLPELRRMVIVVDYDFGKVTEVMRLYKTSRIDCYKAVVNGETWKKKVGWAKCLEAIRKSFVRVGSL